MAEANNKACAFTPCLLCVLSQRNGVGDWTSANMDHDRDLAAVCLQYRL